MTKALPIEVGTVYGYITAVAEGSRPGRGRYLCHCGVEIEILKTSARNGNTTSCGCRRKETLVQMKTTHNLRGHPLYGTWADMRKRCLNPKSRAYLNYGGRGISISEPWENFAVFVADMGEKPSPKHTLDREDNDGDYSVANCRWALVEVQATNKRNSLRYSYRGKDLTLAELSAESSKYGINKALLRSRINKGFTLEDAVERPVARRGVSILPREQRAKGSGISFLYPKHEYIN